MIILPGVTFTEKASGFINFCRTLKLWQEPQQAHAEFTGILIIKCLWFILAIGGIILFSRLEFLALNLACIDLALRAKGIKSSYFFVPIWILMALLCLLVLLLDYQII